MVLVNSSVRKTLKWTKKLFFDLLDLSTVNAYILYCKYTKNIKHRKFVQKIIEQQSLAVLKKVTFQDQRDQDVSVRRVPIFFVWSSAHPSIGQSSYLQLLAKRIQDVAVSSASLAKSQANDG